MRVPACNIWLYKVLRNSDGGIGQPFWLSFMILGAEEVHLQAFCKLMACVTMLDTH